MRDERDLQSKGKRKKERTASFPREKEIENKETTAKKSTEERDLQLKSLIILIMLTCHCCIWIRSVSVEKVIHMSRAILKDSHCQGSQFPFWVPCFHFCPSCNQLVKHRQGTITSNAKKCKKWIQ